MHCEYASALASGVCPAESDPPAEGAVVVGPEPALETVGDFDPAEQAVTVTPNATTTAAHSCDGRIIPPCRQPDVRASSSETDTPSAV
jgi:hypothetical protein